MFGVTDKSCSVSFVLCTLILFVLCTLILEGIIALVLVKSNSETL